MFGAEIEVGKEDIKLIMKITGNKGYVKFDLENGYVMKAEGEMLIDKTFIVYKNSMQTWEQPHEEEVSNKQIDNIIQIVEEMMNEDTIKIVFE